MLTPRRLARAFTELTASRSAAVGVAIILFWIFVAVAAPLIAPHGPTEMHDARLEAPSLQHWLRTDHLARDVMSRLSGVPAWWWRWRRFPSSSGYSWPRRS